MVAILLQAGVDARSGDESAREWLSGPDAELYAEVSGIDCRHIWSMVSRWSRMRPKTRRCSAPAIVIKIWAAVPGG